MAVAQETEILEAAILHQLDMIDAQVDMFGASVSGRKDPGDDWTGWVRSLDRYFFCG
jgi:3'-5' exoribonuclease